MFARRAAARAPFLRNAARFMTAVIHRRGAAGYFGREMAEPATASEVLKDEHRTIGRVLAVLERLLERDEAGRGFERAALARCVEFFRLFADACHHHKEEELLFPLLEARGIPREGGPIGVMLYEHRLGRGHVAAMAEALERAGDGDGEARERFRGAAESYLDLLAQHIFKEDQVLFPMGDGVLSEEDQADLAGRFCSLDCPAITGRTHAQLAAIADELEARWTS